MSVCKCVRVCVSMSVCKCVCMCACLRQSNASSKQTISVNVCSRHSEFSCRIEYRATEYPANTRTIRPRNTIMSFCTHNHGKKNRMQPMVTGMSQLHLLAVKKDNRCTQQHDMHIHTTYTPRTHHAHIHLCTYHHELDHDEFRAEVAVDGVVAGKTRPQHHRHQTRDDS